MSDTLKNRLLGTVILVALVVIFLPQWLDGEKRSSDQSFLEVPDKPEAIEIQPVDKVDIESLRDATSLPDNIEDVQPQDKELESLLDKQSSNSNIDETKFEAESIVEDEQLQNTENNQSNSQNLTDNAQIEIEVEQGGWVIQLGVFGDKANVQRVVRQAATAGYRVYSQPVATPNGTLTKVFVGPELDISKLEKALPHLKEVTGLEGKITEYQVSAD